MAELLEEAFEEIAFPAAEPEEDKPIRIAVVGRPNVGKSTLVNYLLDEERCVVSPIAGTTRDSIDVDILANGKKFTLIDTAGIRRKKQSMKLSINLLRSVQSAHLTGPISAS